VTTTTRHKLKSLAIFATATTTTPPLLPLPLHCFRSTAVAVPAAVHLAGAAALAKALGRRATGFYAPLEPPSLQEGGRAWEERTTPNRQRWQFG
jgi:hypothetical protein